MPDDVRLEAFEAGQGPKYAAHVAARTAMAEGRLTIPHEFTRLRSQLGDLIERPTSGGGRTVSSPRRGGAHGDVASAFILAVHAALTAPMPIENFAHRFTTISRWADMPGRGF
jgi:hypothetical protein